MEQAEQGARRPLSPGPQSRPPSLAQALPPQCPPRPWSHAAFPAALAWGEDVPAECAEWWDWQRLEGFWPCFPGSPPPIACRPMARNPSQRPPCQGPRQGRFTEQSSSAHGVGRGRPADPPPPGPALSPGRAERSVLSPDSDSWTVIRLPLRRLPVLFLLEETFCYGSARRSPEQGRPGPLAWLTASRPPRPAPFASAGRPSPARRLARQRQSSRGLRAAVTPRPASVSPRQLHRGPPGSKGPSALFFFFFFTFGHFTNNLHNCRDSEVAAVAVDGSRLRSPVARGPGTHPGGADGGSGTPRRRSGPSLLVLLRAATSSARSIWKKRLKSVTLIILSKRAWPFSLLVIIKHFPVSTYERTLE